jgi:2-oxoglutarate ferredoxin oxidoreductase subunit alpha
VQRRRRDGNKVAWVHLTHLSPLPNDLGEILRRYQRIVVPELNMGQLSRIVRADYLVDATPLTKMQGLPFTLIEIEDAIDIALKEVTQR